MILIRRTSGVLVVVPNSFLFKHSVDILTNRVKGRVQIITSLAYGENLQEAIRLISDVIKNCNTLLQDEEVQVLATQFGSSSMDIEDTCWTNPRPVDVKSQKVKSSL